MYRHKFVSNADLILHQELEMYANNGFASEEIVEQIDEYRKKFSKDLLGFNFSF